MKRNAYFAMCGLPLPFSWVRRTASPRIDSLKRLAPRRRPPPKRNLRLAALQSEQAALRDQATRVATQGAVRRHDAMAGNHDRVGVRAERRSGRARCLLVPGLTRDDLVGCQLAVRNACRRGEDALLERCKRCQVDLHVERAAPAGEVLVKLREHAVAGPPIRKDARSVGVRDPRELARIGRRAVVNVHDAARADRDPERTERRIHDVVSDRDKSFALRAREEMLAGLIDKWCERIHRTASFNFFIASATRERAASSLHPSVSATSAYDRPSTLRRTKAARCPVGSARTAVARSESVTPSRSGAASRKSSSGTTRRDRRT